MIARVLASALLFAAVAAPVAASDTAIGSAHGVWRPQAIFPFDFFGRKREMRFISVPPGAEIEIDGVPTGRHTLDADPPLQMTVEEDAIETLSLVMPGYVECRYGSAYMVTGSKLDSFDTFSCTLQRDSAKVTPLGGAAASGWLNPISFLNGLTKSP